MIDLAQWASESESTLHPWSRSGPYVEVSAFARKSMTDPPGLTRMLRRPYACEWAKDRCRCMRVRCVVRRIEVVTQSVHGFETSLAGQRRVGKRKWGYGTSVESEATKQDVS